MKYLEERSLSNHEPYEQGGVLCSCRARQGIGRARTRKVDYDYDYASRFTRLKHGFTF
jgi:hypothetical protein